MSVAVKLRVDPYEFISDRLEGIGGHAIRKHFKHVSTPEGLTEDLIDELDADIFEAVMDALSDVIDFEAVQVPTEDEE